jgi:hypothetical protein
LLPADYYPDPIGDRASEIARQLGGELVHSDAVPDDAPDEAIY